MFNINIRGNSQDVYAMVWGVLQATSSAGSMMFLDNVFMDYIKQRSKRTFDAEQTPWGSAWDQLDEDTPSFRESQGFDPHAPINVRSGWLRHWATESDTRYTFRPNGVTARYPEKIPRGENRKKVVTAQEGRKRSGRQRVPARPVVGFAPNDVMMFLALYQVWLVDFLHNPVDLDIGPA